MADITTPQIVKWSNERARTIADAIDRLYYQVQAYLTDWSAEGISALITAAGATGTIADGSDVDGRTRITGTTLVNLQAALGHATTGLKQALDTVSVTGVGATIKAVADGIQVNGSPR